MTKLETPKWIVHAKDVGNDARCAYIVRSTDPEDQQRDFDKLCEVYPTPARHNDVAMHALSNASKIVRALNLQAKHDAGIRCFHVDNGQRCTRYLDGSTNERSDIVKWLREICITNANTLELANIIEHGGHLKPIINAIFSGENDHLTVRELREKMQGR